MPIGATRRVRGTRQGGRAISQGTEPTPPSGPDHDDPLARALASFMRAEFAAPVDVVGGYIGLLAEDAERSHHAGYAADLSKMKAAHERLSRLIEQSIEGGLAALGPDIAASSGKLRHDLRTPISAILGYGELLAEQARDDGFAAFAETAEVMLDAARRLLGQVDTFVEGIRAEAGHPAAAAGSGLARPEAVAAIRAVLVRPPDLQPVVTGEILVVDDDAANVDLLARRLTRDGHEVTSMSSGEDALAWIEGHTVDLVLLDLIMPGLNGVDVLRVLRSREDTRLTPVIIISGLDEADGAIRCIEAGADDYLAKPVDAVLLRARINAALERKRLRDREMAMTRRLQAEQERADALLRSMLPASVVERLRGGETEIADHFDAATILFSDIVGFTALAATLPPGQTLEVLNTIFSEFDRLAVSFGIEKIKTIGDAYMAAGGLPEARADHAAAIVAMALCIPAVVETVSRRIDRPLTVRIGIDTGPVAAGIIGSDKFIYDVWGDAVNTASRMEAHGTPGRVHITEAVRTALGSAYAYDPLTPIDIKGKGVMQTYLIR